MATSEAHTNWMTTEISQPQGNALAKPVRPAPLPPPPEENLFLGILRRRWKLLSACLIASTLAAVGVTSRFASTSHTVSASLLYKGFSRPEGTNLYVPNVASLIPLMKSRENLQRVRDNLSLDLPLVVLSRVIAVKTINKTNILEISLDWSDPAQAQEILDELIAGFLEATDEARRGDIDENLAIVERHLLDSESRLDGASQRWEEFVDTNGDMVRFHQRLEDRTQDINKTLDAQELKTAAMQAQYETLDQLSQQILREIKESMLEWEIARFREILSLSAPRHRERVRAENILAQLNKMTEQVDNQDSVRAWEERLQSLVAGVFPMNALNQKPPAAVQELQLQLKSIREKRDTLALNMVPVPTENSLLEKQLQQLEQEAEEKRFLIKDAQDLAAKVQDAQVERDDLRTQRASLLRLKESPARALSILASPAPALGGRSSNMLKLFLGSLFFLTICLSAPVIGYEVLNPPGDVFDEAARYYGMPTVARRPELPKPAPTGEHPEEEFLRLASLRIQQSVSGAGSVVLFSPLKKEDGDGLLLPFRIAERLAARGERVLLMDVDQSTDRVNHWEDVLLEGMTPPKAQSHRSGSKKRRETVEEEADWPGLSDYLTFETVEPPDLVFPSKSPSVDCVMLGNTPFPQEGLAMQRMSQLLDLFRQQYSTIFLIGPPVHYRVDLEVLAARCDGIVFTATRGGRLDSKSHEVLRELIELEAPILGVLG